MEENADCIHNTFINIDNVLERVVSSFWILPLLKLRIIVKWSILSLFDFFNLILTNSYFSFGQQLVSFCSFTCKTTRFNLADHVISLKTLQHQRDCYYWKGSKKPWTEHWLRLLIVSFARMHSINNLNRWLFNYLPFTWTAVFARCMSVTQIT